MHPHAVLCVLSLRGERYDLVDTFLQQPVSPLRGNNLPQGSGYVRQLSSLLELLVGIKSDVRHCEMLGTRNNTDKINNKLISYLQYCFI